MTSIYVIGSLRNPQVPKIAQALRAAGWDAFDDWHAAGPHADDCWRDYEKARGRTYIEALNGYAAKHIFEFDLHHLKRCDAALLVLPSGRSSHLELGWVLGQGKPGYVLIDTPDRWDVMFQFATGVFVSVEELIASIVKEAA